MRSLVKRAYSFSGLVMREINGIIVPILMISKTAVIKLKITKRKKLYLNFFSINLDMLTKDLINF